MLRFDIFCGSNKLFISEEEKKGKIDLVFQAPGVAGGGVSLETAVLASNKANMESFSMF